jgi:hypothetical protein
MKNYINLIYKRWVAAAIITALALATMAMSSCSAPKRAQWHLRKAWALDPHLGDSAVIAILDTVIVPGDTILREVVTTEQDTVEIVKDRVVTRIIRNFDTLQVYTECPTDTIVRTVRAACPPQLKLQPKNNWQDRAAFVLVGLILGFVLGWLITKRR